MNSSSYQQESSAVERVQQSLGGISPVHRGVILNVFSFISWCTIASGVLISLAQGTAIFDRLIYDFPNVANGIELPHLLIQVYGILLGLGVILTEMEWTDMIRTFMIVQDWTTRGFVYIFVSLLAYTEKENFDILLYPSLSLIFFGCVYIAMGVLCLKRIRDNRMALYIKLLSHYEMQHAVVGFDDGEEQYHYGNAAAGF